MFDSQCNYTMTSSQKENYDVESKVRPSMIYALTLACVCILICYVRGMCLRILSERQTRKIRQKLFRSMLEKDFIFFDKHKTGEFSSHLSGTIDKLSAGIGEKLGSAIQEISTAIVAFLIGN